MSILIIFHQYVYIAIWGFLTTSEGTKKPRLHNGLRLEVIGYQLYHGLLIHNIV